MNNTAQYIDVMIAGRGAAAYAAALYTARYRMKTVIAAALFGGETATGGLIENYPGCPEIDGYELMNKFAEQTQKLDVPVISSDLQDISRHGQNFICTLTNGTKYEVSAVILAIGRERRTLGIPHEEAWMGKGVSYCSTCDAPLYRNSESVAVVGGGNAAVEGAILLAKYARTVYLIYRKDKFTRPEPILLQTLAQTPAIKPLFMTEVAELIGTDETGLSALRISRPYEGRDVLKVAGLFIEAGADPRTDIPKSLGLELDPITREVNVDKGQRTNMPGIYAAGDLTNGSDLKQTITAASQGAIAALAAYQHVMEMKAKAAAIV